MLLCWMLTKPATCTSTKTHKIFQRLLLVTIAAFFIFMAQKQNKTVLNQLVCNKPLRA